MKLKTLLLPLMLLVSLSGDASHGTGKVAVNDISLKSLSSRQDVQEVRAGSYLPDTTPDMALQASKDRISVVSGGNRQTVHTETSGQRKVPETQETTAEKLERVRKNLELYYKPGKKLLPSGSNTKSKQHALRTTSGYQKTLNRFKRKIIMEKFKVWKGVRYKWGGTSKDGIDCSALVQKFARELHIELPRTTGLQIRTGKKIGKHELRTGDLVFFWTSPVQRHVGIYVGKSEFIHASSSKGVTKSSLNETYWKERYDTGVRVTA